MNTSYFIAYNCTIVLSSSISEDKSKVLRGFVILFLFFFVSWVLFCFASVHHLFPKTLQADLGVHLGYE